MSEIQEILTRFWDQLIAQPSGPLAFRLILQPIMAAILAILDGLKDARAGRPLYTWTILTDPAQRAGYLREGLKRVCRVIIFALVMDAIYQFLVLRWFYLGEALVTAFVLAVLPYLLIRGPAARIARQLEPARCGLRQGTVRHSEHEVTVKEYSPQRRRARRVRSIFLMKNLLCARSLSSASRGLGEISESFFITE